MNRKMKGKKGHAELFVLVALLFIVALSFIVANKVHVGFQEGVTEMGDQPEAVKVMENTSGVYKILDYLFLMFLVFSLIAVLISAYFIKTTPLFFILSIIVLVVLIIISAAYSNAFELIIGDDQFIDQASTFSITSYIMQYLPYFMFFLALIFLVVLYAKSRESGGFAV